MKQNVSGRLLVCNSGSPKLIQALHTISTAEYDISKSEEMSRRPRRVFSVRTDDRNTRLKLKRQIYYSSKPLEVQVVVSGAS